MRRLAPDDVACWVLKSTRRPAEISPDWSPGAEQTLARCVRRSYRLTLMAEGQPCLLWISGRQQPGVHGLGVLTGAADADSDNPSVPVRVTLLDEVIPRAELLTDPRTRDAEVLRMPAGSNPSWLSARQFAAVLERVRADALGAWTT